MTPSEHYHTARHAARLLAGYRPPPGVYDEILAPGGGLRPHWEGLVQSLERMGRQELGFRREHARRILREHGVTYNVYGDAMGLDRPWDLDLLPLIIPPKEWAGLEKGLAQRTRLLNLILADFYGPQRLIREGWLPPALLHANPGFLRPCHGFRVPRDLFLGVHAVDLARSPNGSWWVLADRTQAPSGSGYALENRMVLSRVLPDEFRECHVERLAAFFKAQRDMLRSLAPQPKDNANVVLLTPGPYNETYFEHAFFARYLGFPLVEGGDLTVRDRRVFIKTLAGLQPVDVILRRVDDAFCDPLELRADSSLGVPGLLEAARAGNVAIANALGSGAVETPALMAFLPGLCKHLLDEDLKLPSVATWWCGQPREHRYVLDHLEKLVVKRAFRHGGGELVFGSQLDAAQRAAFIDAMAAAPYDFVGQEQVPLSTAPVLDNQRLEPRAMVWRSYVCGGGGEFSVMPGGLTRRAPSPGELVVSMQTGGGSKDTWVLTDGPVSQLTLLSSDIQAVNLERAAAEMPSRAADNMFWLGRYVERLEDTVRVLRRVLTRLAGEEAGNEETPEFTTLVRLLVNLDLLPARFGGRFTMAQVEKEVLQLIYHVHRLGTVREVLGRLKQIAFSLRSIFSADTWRILNKLQVNARAQPARIPAEAPGVAQYFDCRSRCVQRDGDGKHDAGPWLALP